MSEKIVPLPKRSACEGLVEIEDDGCRWILDLPGGPFAVLPCVCGSPVNIYSTRDLRHHKVECPQCGRNTPESIARDLLDVLKLWNEMVQPQTG
jgi:hypothetical protein